MMRQDLYTLLHPFIMPNIRPMGHYDRRGREYFKYNKGWSDWRVAQEAWNWRVPKPQESWNIDKKGYRRFVRAVAKIRIEMCGPLEPPVSQFKKIRIHYQSWEALRLRCAALDLSFQELMMGDGSLGEIEFALNEMKHCIMNIHNELDPT